MTPNSMENELKQLIIETLDLEDIKVEDILSEDALFNDGLGLDSIDALELGVALQKRYGIKLNPESKEIHKHFASIKALASFISKQQEKMGGK